MCGTFVVICQDIMWAMATDCSVMYPESGSQTIDLVMVSDSAISQGHTYQYDCIPSSLIRFTDVHHGHWKALLALSEIMNLLQCKHDLK